MIGVRCVIIVRVMCGINEKAAVMEMNLRKTKQILTKHSTQKIMSHSWLAGIMSSPHPSSQQYARSQTGWQTRHPRMKM